MSVNYTGGGLDALIARKRDRSKPLYRRVWSALDNYVNAWSNAKRASSVARARQRRRGGSMPLRLNFAYIMIVGTFQIVWFFARLALWTVAFVAPVFTLAILAGVLAVGHVVALPVLTAWRRVRR